MGERIRARQRETRVTNEELAAAAGVHVKTVSQWRHDKQMPTDDNLSAVAPLLKSTFFHLRHGRNPEPAAGEQDDAYTGGSRVRELSTREGFSVYSRYNTKRLPPKAYEIVYEYTKKLEAAGLEVGEIEEAERFLIDGAYNKLNARDPGEKSEDDLILDIKAAWQFVRDVVKRSGRKL